MAGCIQEVERSIAKEVDCWEWSRLQISRECDFSQFTSFDVFLFERGIRNRGPARQDCIFEARAYDKLRSRGEKGRVAGVIEVVVAIR